MHTDWIIKFLVNHWKNSRPTIYSAKFLCSVCKPFESSEDVLLQEKLFHYYTNMLPLQEKKWYLKPGLASPTSINSISSSVKGFLLYLLGKSMLSMPDPLGVEPMGLDEEEEGLEDEEELEEDAAVPLPPSTSVKQ